MTAMTMMMVVVVMRTVCEVRWSKVTLIQKVTQPGVCVALVRVWGGKVESGLPQYATRQ